MNVQQDVCVKSHACCHARKNVLSQRCPRLLLCVEQKTYAANCILELTKEQFLK